MVAAAQIAKVLRPWLGYQATAALPKLPFDLCYLMNAYAPGQSLAALRKRLDSLLFQAVYRETGGTLLILLDDDSRVRMRVEDFSVLADEVMYPLFEDFPEDARHMLLLREYALTADSLSALRALYTRYAAFHTGAELQTIAKIARSCYPPFRLRGWLQ